MISYLIKSASCLALLLCFYHFILEKEKMHNFNRYYLLIGVIISLVIPFATITTYVPTDAIANTLIKIKQPEFSADTLETIEVEEVIDYTKYFVSFYLLISSLLLIRFGRNLFKIIQKIRLNEQIKYNKATLVLVDDQILPHTFWKAIFINKKEYENGNIEEELFTHELTHVTQKHTIDVLLIEFLQILFWINPLFIFLKKAVQLNHEFLADEKVIHQHKNTFQYQHLLLNKAAWNNEYYLASNLNYSLTKKRLKMMTTQSSQSKIWIKKLAVIPLLAGFVFLFAERVEAQEKEEIIEVIEVFEKQPKKNIITENEVYKKYFHRNGHFIFKDKNGNKIKKTYDDLNEKEKARLIPPPPLRSKKIVPTEKQFEALKDNSKFAVWLDGKVVKNETLNNYKHTDFATYSNSFVYKNARSKRFPQENQANLETTKYFEAKNAKRVKEFEDYKKNYKKEIIEIVEDKKNKNVLIDAPIIKNYPGSKQSISKEIPFLTTTIKAEKETNTGTIKDIRLKLKDVNALKITYNKEENVPSLIKKATDPKFNKNWFITIDGQKYYYTFDKKERVVRYYKDGKLVNLDIVKEYNKKHKIFEKLKKEGKHYVFKTETEQKVIKREWSDLGGMYFRMSRADKSKVPFPVNPIKPYVKLRKGNKVWYKKKSELTEEDKLLLPPAPPKPNASKEEVLKAKKAYQDWKKRTGNDIPPPPRKKNN
ncbi:M56 family metallopeptidase [Polaribacter sp. KT 15]|uniref:M56 family metallopeptidase n=1 Tax=Polaribacter sp. KT 15 TaxID=1896175 RepID=UPI00090C0500|nr:M56 family metallopeptidase [Polaribacter sp. KT 15]SHM81338.1 Signal transducer regulating beta-lactamase production, contains metallopeptidase domain [Polaribacter sp. KT 15]